MTEKPSSFNAKAVLIFAAGIVAGFVAGFALANGINRGEDEKLRVELARLRAGAQAKGGDAGQQQVAGQEGDEEFPTLTDEQLKNAVAQADANPRDAVMQRKVGQALYVYAWQKGNASILPDVARVLKRAHELDPKDFKTTVMAGDAHFLVARSGGDVGALGEARKFYEAALAAQPEDAVVRTSLGLTYFHDKPSDPRRAIREYRRALRSDPRQELTLQSLAQALIETGGVEEAARLIGEIERLNPSNQELPQMRARLEQKRNEAEDKK